MPQTVLSLVDAHVVSLEIRVDADDWQGKYTHLEVWRSVLSDAGPYEPMTSTGWTPAKIPAEAGPATGASGSLAAVQGKILTLVLNEQTTLTYTFTGASPLTFAQAAAQLNVAFPSHISAGVDSVGKFFVETKQLGSVASIRAVASDAQAMLGLPTTPSFGKEARPVLINGVSRYFYKDYFGQKKYFYKSRFYNANDSTVSDFSAPIPGGRGAIGVHPDQVVLGFVKVVDLSGRVISNQEVLVYNSFLSERTDSYTVLGGNQRKYTDDNGYVEFELLRGSLIDVSIPGTALTRRVKVPTDTAVEKFDLLDPTYGDADAFAVQRIEIPYADRRNW